MWYQIAINQKLQPHMNQWWAADRLDKKLCVISEGFVGIVGSLQDFSFICCKIILCVFSMFKEIILIEI